MSAVSERPTGPAGPAHEPEGALLEVEDLTVSFRRRGGLFGPRTATVRAVNGVSFSLDAGETLGLVGESGSGKSTTGRAILRLLDPDAGSIRFEGIELTELPRRLPPELRRGIQVVFQDPFSSLNPSMTIADLVGEPLTVHLGLKGRDRSERVVELLESVGLDRNHLERYPHEFSGGQRQRLSIARALAGQPRLLVLDEPVSSLDVSTQSQVINLLEDLQADTGVAYLFIAHDLSVVRHASERIAVMYLGHVVEIGPAGRVYDAPAHPYTQALLASIPVANPLRQRTRRQERQRLARGELPSPLNPPPGCPFSTRCPHVMEVCRRMPPMVAVPGGGRVACFLYGGADDERAGSGAVSPAVAS